jgi:hypothetical protein
LRRLAAKTEAANIRLLLYLQFAGTHVIGQTTEPGHSSLVAECAKEAGIEVVDEFAVLKAVGDRSIEELRSYYVSEPDGSTGHKSSFGNLQVARLIEAALKQQPAKRTPPPAQWSTGSLPEEPPDDRRNLIQSSEELETVVPPAPHAELTALRSWFSQVRSYRISAKGGPGEHYVALTSIPIEQGSAIAALEVRAEATSYARVQLISASGHGAFSDIDLTNLTAIRGRFSDTRNAASGIERASDGWYRVWVRATFPPGSGPATLIIQLADAAERYGFVPNGESILVRRIQVVRGRELAAYQPTSSAQKSK